MPSLFRVKDGSDLDERYIQTVNGQGPDSYGNLELDTGDKQEVLEAARRVSEISVSGGSSGDTGTVPGLSDYMPLSGGTMTGNISFRNAGKILSVTESSQVQIYGGTKYETGALLGLYGKSHATYPGWLRLSVHDGAATSMLIGKPDGTLTWNNSNIVRSVNGVAADAGGNVTVTATPNYVYIDSTNVVYVGGSIFNSTHKYYAPEGGTWLIWGTYQDEVVIGGSGSGDDPYIYGDKTITFVNTYAGGSLLMSMSKSYYKTASFHCIQIA